MEQASIYGRQSTKKGAPVAHFDYSLFGLLIEEKLAVQRVTQERLDVGCTGRLTRNLEEGLALTIYLGRVEGEALWPRPTL